MFDGRFCEFLGDGDFLMPNPHAISEKIRVCGWMIEGILGSHLSPSDPPNHLFSKDSTWMRLC